ncbi:MAG: hypothetical protein QXY49_00390 [Thermofilaceae archaeon]
MENWQQLEELFKGCRKALRVIRVLLQYKTPMTKYAIESQALVYDTRSLLKRLEEIGVIHIIDGRPRRYMINLEHPLVKSLEKMMLETGYL